MLGSFPLFSDFKLGRFAGGGIRRAVATFPRLCKPCRGVTEDLTASTGFPLCLSNRLSVQYLLFPSLPLVMCPKRSDIALKCHLVRKFFSAPLPICHLRVLLAFHSAVPMTLVHLALNLYSPDWLTVSVSVNWRQISANPAAAATPAAERPSHWNSLGLADPACLPIPSRLWAL